VSTDSGLAVKKKGHANATDEFGAFLRVAVNIISVEFLLCPSTMYSCLNGTWKNKLTHSKTESL
jgi:hypothetical protein